MSEVTVSNVMSKVLRTVGIGDALADAERVMSADRIRHLPVVDGAGRLVGLVTHRMVLAAWVSHGHPDTELPSQIAATVPVEMIMEKNVVTIRPDARASEAARVLETSKYGCLPVTDGGTLVGIVTEADFVRLARRLLERQELPLVASRPGG
jgi:CBS domain-containing membrane protein